MKKMLKLFTAFAMISLVISFASCDLETEDELLNATTENVSGNGNGNANSGSTGNQAGNANGSNTGTGNNAADNTGNNPSGGNSGSDSSDVVDEPDDVEPIGNVASSLWSMFDGADMQVWEKTADLEETDEGLDITIGSSGWWGMCFCNSASTGVDSPDCVTFDMSKVAKITFEAKASKKASMWVSQSDAESKAVNQTKISLSTSYATKTFNLKNPGKKDYGVLDIGGGDLNTTTESDVVISIKNIKFLDASGTEIVPTRNK